MADDPLAKWRALDDAPATSAAGGQAAPEADPLAKWRELDAAPAGDGKDAPAAADTAPAHLGSSNTKMRSQAPVVQPGGLADAGKAALYGGLKDIPIIGAPLDALSTNHAAWLRSKLFGDDYEKAKATIQANEDATLAAHPIAETVGGMVGSTVAMAPLGMTAAGGKLLGLTGPLAQRIILGSGTGAVTGAADAAIRGGDPITGGELGGSFGAIAPPAGAIIGAVGSKLFGAIKSPTPEAAAGRSILESANASGKTSADFNRLFGENPGMAPVDVDAVMRARAQGFASEPGAPQALIDKAVKARQAMAAGNVNQAYDASLGASQNALDYVDNLKATTRANAKTAYDDVYARTGQVDTRNTVKTIDDKLGPAFKDGTAQSVVKPTPEQNELLDIRRRLTDGTKFVADPKTLGGIQSDLRVKAGNLTSSAVGGERNIGGSLSDVRQALVKDIDAASPMVDPADPSKGRAFAAAQSQYKDDKDIEDAFQKGLSFFQNKSGAGSLETRPEAWQRFWDQASPAERDALKVGIREGAENAKGGVNNAALRGETLAAPEFNQKKLEIVLGKDEAASLIKTLKNEHTKASVNADLTRGSMTAVRLAAQAANKVNVPQIVKPNLTAVGLAESALTALPQKLIVAPVAKAFGGARNRITADALMNPEKFTRLLGKAEAAAGRRTGAARAIRGAATLALRGGSVPATRLFGGP